MEHTITINNVTRTFTVPEGSTVQEAVDALVAAGAFGETTPPPQEIQTPEVQPDAGFFDSLLASLQQPAVGSVPQMATQQTAAARQEGVNELADLPILAANTSEMPEFSHANTGSFMGDMGLGLGRTMLYDEDYAALIEQMAPGTKLMQDPEGNIVIQLQDGSYQRLDAEGFSPRNALNLGGDMTAMGGGARLATTAAKRGPEAFTKTLNYLGRSAPGQAAVAGGYAAGKDMTGNAVTGQDPLDIDLGRAAGEAMIGGGLQLGLNKLLGPVANKIEGMNTARNMRDDIANAGPNQLADTARTALEAAGKKYENMSPEHIAAVNNALLEFPNLKGAELGRAIYSRGVENVKPTTGYTTLDPGVLRNEELARGQGGQRGADVTQATITDPVNRIQGVVDEVDPYKQGQTPLASAQEELIAQRQAGYEGFTGVKNEQGIPEGGRFKEARERLWDASNIPHQQSSMIIDDVFDAVRKDQDIGVARAIAGEPSPGLKGVSRKGGELLPMPQKGEKPWSAGEWLNWAERQKGQPGGQAAANAVYKNISRMVEDQVLYGGGNEAMEDYLATLADYKGFKDSWSANKLIERISGPNGKIATSPSNVATYVLGGRNAGFLSKNGAVEAVQQMKQRLPHNEWLQVRQELIYRMIGGDKLKGKNSGAGMTSMRKTFLDAKDKHGKLLEDILDDGTGNGKQQLELYDNFTKYADDQGTDAGKESRLGSQTGNAINSLMKMMPFETGKTAMGLTADVLDKGAVRRSTQQMLDPNLFRAKQAPPLPGLGGIFGQLYDPAKDAVLGQ